MTDTFILVIGIIAQILFSSRFIIQWFKSEKAKRPVVPKVFWILSLMASLMFFVYGYLRNDFAIMLGQVLTYYICIRNLQLQKLWKTFPLSLRYFIVLAPIIACIYYFSVNTINTDLFFKNEDIPKGLLILGVVSQIIFTLRFIYQWLYSEKNKTSALPIGFWAMSVLGSLLILIYGIYRSDIILIVAHLFGLPLYARNIIIIKRSRSKKD